MHQTSEADAARGESSVDLLEDYLRIRGETESLCRPLAIEDYVAQPMADVSPPKWHLAHTSWFFEEFVLLEFVPTYRLFHEQYRYLFNSYYEGVGARHSRPQRGTATRPTVAEVYGYREAVDGAMVALLSSGDFPDAGAHRVILGLHHEQQHQELLITDSKYILGMQPLQPPYGRSIRESVAEPEQDRWLDVPAGCYEIGHDGPGFCFDNEVPRHTVYLQDAQIRSTLVRNGEFLAFIDAGGYQDFRHWLSDGWAWAQAHEIDAPLYWRQIDGQWFHYTLDGLVPVDPAAPLMHVSFYEASAFAAWLGVRLPTEQEWETAQAAFAHGARWEWTQSAYGPYPGYKPPAGPIGEYNGKFMANQLVLRGGSVATPQGHARPSYRNFFYLHQRWQYTGIRLAR